MLVFTLLMTVFMPITVSARTRPINTLDSGNGLNMSIDSNGILNWDDVPGATGYKVTLTKPNFTHLYSWDTTNSVFALISSIDQLKYNSGQYTIGVSAKGVSASESMLYYYTSNVDQLETPNGLYWDGDTANWSAVDGASIYHVELNNFDGRVTLQSTNSTSFDFSGFSPEDGWTFRVQARQSNSGTLSAKRDSLFIESPAKGTRTRPINALNSGNALNMNIGTDGILRWDEVSGATGYTISITQPNITNLYNWNSDNEAFALISSIDQLKYNSGQYTIGVSAKGVSASESMLYYYTSNVDQLETPNGLYWDGDTANWSAVDGASIYHVELNNFDGRVTLQSTNSTSFDFSGFSPEDGWTFRVQARQSNSGTLSAKRDSLFIESPAYEGGSITTYTCSFNSNGGTGTMADVTGLTGTYTLPANGFTAPANKQFKGWSLTSDGAIITSVEMTTDRTIYAIWEDIPATLINEVSATVTAPVGGEHPSFTVTVPDGAHYTAVVDTWYDLNNNGAHLTNSDTFVTDNEYQVRIHFTANTGYEIANGASYTINDTPNYSTFDTAKQRGMIFVATAPAVTTYTVTFDSAGGSAVTAQSIEAGQKATKPADPTKANYAFAGWYSDSGLTQAFDFNTPITGDITLYAKWDVVITAANATVTVPVAGEHPDFNPISGDSSRYTVEFVTWYLHEAPYPDLAANSVFEHGKYYSLRIRFTPNAGYQFDSNTVFTVNGEATASFGGIGAREYSAAAYATTYTVTYDANGGTGSMADATGVSGEYTLLANGFTAPDGKQFKAWSVGGDEKAVGDKITVTANTTVTAIWEAVEYNVTVTGGTASVGAGAPITKATMGTTVTLTAGAAPTGQMFDKWVVNGVVVDDANSATTTFVMPAGEVTATATYKDIPVVTYTVTFDSAGGSAVTAQTIEAGQKATKPADPTKAGYDFKGWTLNGSAYDFNSAVNGDITLVATWEQQQVVPTVYTVTFDSNGGSAVTAQTIEPFLQDTPATLSLLQRSNLPAQRAVRKHTTSAKAVASSMKMHSAQRKLPTLQLGAILLRTVTPNPIGSPIRITIGRNAP